MMHILAVQCEYNGFHIHPLGGFKSSTGYEDVQELMLPLLALSRLLANQDSQYQPFTAPFTFGSGLLEAELG